MTTTKTRAASPQQTIARLQADLIARYRLRSRPGRLEELELVADPKRGVSTGYGCGSVRLRLMSGRKWVAHLDLPADRYGGWQRERVYDVLDVWFHADKSRPAALLRVLNEPDRHSRVKYSEGNRKVVYCTECRANHTGTHKMDCSQRGAAK